MATLKKQFLDYAGLSQFWGIIVDKFSTKTDAVKYNSLSITPQESGDETTLSLVYTNVAGTGTSVIIPGASDTHAGLLSADHFQLIEDIDNKINDMAPFHGFKIEGNEVNLQAKRANIGLKFETEGSIDNGTRKAYIDLVDLAYPDGQSWTEITESEYDVSLAHHYAFDNKYYKWSVEGQVGPKNNLGAPLINQPVSRIDVTELVKTGLLNNADIIYKAPNASTGEKGGMYLQLNFIVHDSDSGTDTTKEVLIDVTDLVDIYTEGEGIEIINDSMSDGKNERTGTIKLRAANYNNNNELGGIRVGYTTDDTKQLYKVQLDANNNAFVAVPWEHVNVTISTPKDVNNHPTDVNADGDEYLTVTGGLNAVTDDNGITTNNFNFEIAVGDGLKNAETYAKSSIQTVAVGEVDETAETGVTKDDYIAIATEVKNWGKDVTIELTDSAKASLKLADESVQNIVTTNIQRGEAGSTHTPAGNDLEVLLINTAGTAYDEEKGQKTIKITLGEKTIESLDKADTAMQTVSIMGTTLDIDSSTYSVDQGHDALKLGTAANVNIASSIPAGVITDATVEAALKSDVLASDGETVLISNVDHVATARAVKVYVDTENDSQSETLRTYTDNAILALDSSVSTGKSTADEVAYGNAYGEGVTAQTVMIGVTQVDGKLSTASPYILSIADIGDFAPLTSDDITSICQLAAASE